jgi:hypothetical protein
MVVAQGVSFGIRGYAEPTDTFVPALIPQPGPGLNRYSVGPTVEVGLPRSFAIQFDALRTRLEYRQESSFTSFSSFYIESFKLDTVGHSWQFPLIVKYYIQPRTPFRAYPELGFAIRHMNAKTTNVATRVGTLCDPVPVSCGTTVTTATYPSRDILHEWTNGIVLGGGADFPWRRFHFQPELRYTRWLKEAFGPLDVVSNRNALDVVIGVTFATIK